jgi:hypothetical protein
VAVSEKKVPGKKPERVEIPVMLPHSWNFDAVFGSPKGGAMTLHAFSSPPSMDSMVMEFGDSGDDEPLVRRGLPRRPKTRSGGVAGVISRVKNALCGADDKGFSLKSSDPADRLVGILIAVHQGNRSEAEKALRGLGLKPSDVKGWDERKRARSYYFALRLLAYGLCIDSKVFDALSAKRPSGSAALAWYNLALKELGRLSAYIHTSEPEDGYIAWKMDVESKPTSVPYSLVP